MVEVGNVESITIHRRNNRKSSFVHHDWAILTFDKKSCQRVILDRHDPTLPFTANNILFCVSNSILVADWVARETPDGNSATYLRKSK